MRLVIVGISDLSGGDEQIEGVIDLLIVESLHLLVLCLFHAFFLMTGELQLLVVAPEHVGPGLHGLPGQDIVKVDHLVASPVSH